MDALAKAIAAAPEVDITRIRKLLKLEVVNGSDLPFRVIRRRNGVTMYRSDDASKVLEFLAKQDLEVLERKPTRRYHS